MTQGQRHSRDDARLSKRLTAIRYASVSNGLSFSKVVSDGFNTQTQ